MFFFTFVVADLSGPEDVIFNWLAITATWLAGYGLRRFEERALDAARGAAEVELAGR